MNKAVITDVFEKLGPERVERGLAAFADDWRVHRTDVWQHCFLGRALDIQEGTINSSLVSVGIEDTCDVVTGAFDHPRERLELHALVLEWLEANRVAPAARPLVEVA